MIGTRSPTRWISSIRYKDGEGEVSIAFAPEIAQFLAQLKKHFTSYQLSKAAALRSTFLRSIATAFS